MGKDCPKRKGTWCHKDEWLCDPDTCTDIDEQLEKERLMQEIRDEKKKRDE